MVVFMRIASNSAKVLQTTLLVLEAAQCQKRQRQKQRQNKRPRQKQKPRNRKFYPTYLFLTCLPLGGPRICFGVPYLSIIFRRILLCKQRTDKKEKLW
ncbi:unnamed protein product [Cylicocyclus nassatus]|uniref:Uncharacterized protein n=1 Tax=Cylicocyclus nassatus TaxID=53992 RepID=A0AA36GZW9_CYLNA|nr:unnamed protein product [Cylicocyclus nassatus]